MQPPISPTSARRGLLPVQLHALPVSHHGFRSPDAPLVSPPPLPEDIAQPSQAECVPERHSVASLPKPAPLSRLTKWTARPPPGTRDRSQTPWSHPSLLSFSYPCPRHREIPWLLTHTRTTLRRLSLPGLPGQASIASGLDFYSGLTPAFLSTCVTR